MTETSPLCALALPPRGTPPEEEMDWRAKTGRVVPGVEVRVVAEDGSILPNDGESVGEFEVRGPWITGSYYGEPAPERFHDGWLRTGDIGSLDDRGFMQISDRTKDVIKSGGEWISSVELENEVMAHPGVVEAAVIAVPDERWSERPLVAVVLEPESPGHRDELVDFLTGRVSRWWLPERWAFIDEVPKTSVGKFDKKVLRAQYADGAFEVVEVEIQTGALTPWAPIRWTSPSACPPSARSWPTWPSTGCARQPTRCATASDPDPQLTAEEKRITRARRAVDKAVVLLAGPSAGRTDVVEDGP